MLTRELCDMCIFGRQYLTSIENWVGFHTTSSTKWLTIRENRLKGLSSNDWFSWLFGLFKNILWLARFIWRNSWSRAKRWQWRLWRFIWAVVCRDWQYHSLVVDNTTHVATTVCYSLHNENIWNYCLEIFPSIEILCPYFTWFCSMLFGPIQNSHAKSRLRQEWVGKTDEEVHLSAWNLKKVILKLTMRRFLI